ncbi:MAG: hypothetical protein ABSG14_06215 [Verrucomicrobiia bacterium]
MKLITLPLLVSLLVFMIGCAGPLSWEEKERYFAAAEKQLTAKQKMVFGAAKTVYFEKVGDIDLRWLMGSVEYLGRTISETKPADLIITVKYNTRTVFGGCYFSRRTGSVLQATYQPEWGWIRFSAPGVEPWQVSFKTYVPQASLTATFYNGRITEGCSGIYENETLDHMMDSIGWRRNKQQ